MNVLDMLQQYLTRVQMSGGGLSPTERELFKGVERDDSGIRPRGMMPQFEEGGTGLPSYLPDAVIRSILVQPSYAEGQVLPQAPNPALNEEVFLRGGPQRDERLMQELGGARDFYRNNEQPLPEGWWATSRQPGESPWASPLNSLMRRGLALY